MISKTTINFPNITSLVSGKNTFVNSYESINECIGLLLRTSKGEMFGDPQFGCNLMKYIHEPNDSILQDLAREDIVSAISRYEPRVTVNTENIDIYSEDNKVYITIQYIINSTGTTSSYELVMLRTDSSK